MASVRSEVQKIAGPILERRGLELVDLQYAKEGKSWVLRLLIDRVPGGVTIADCQAVSEELDTELDHHPIIDRSFLLEVASPGLDRPLLKPADFERFSGDRARIKLYGPLEGRKTFTGMLRGTARGEGEVLLVRIEVDGEVFELPEDAIASANLVPEIEF